MAEVDEVRLHHLKGLFESHDENFQEGIYDFFPGIIYVYDTHTKKLNYVNKKITDVFVDPFIRKKISDGNLCRSVYNNSQWFILTTI